MAVECAHVRFALCKFSAHFTVCFSHQDVSSGSCAPTRHAISPVVGRSWFDWRWVATSATGRYFMSGIVVLTQAGRVLKGCESTHHRVHISLDVHETSSYTVPGQISTF